MQNLDLQNEDKNSLNNLSNQLSNAVERVSQSIVAIDARPRVATSGVVWRENIIVSTNHTIRRDEEITIAMNGEQSFAAKLIGRDPGTDLAVLRVEDETALTSFKPAEINAADAPKVGNLILAVGRTNTENGVSASFGIINMVGGAWRSWRGEEIERLIRLDTEIYLGFSGGALVNPEGQVLGINTSAFGRGAALTIPASTVNRTIDALLAGGKVSRPYLGIGTQPVMLPASLQTKLNSSQTSGLILIMVEPGGAAEKAGLLLGDILISLDETAIATAEDVQIVVNKCSVGDSLKTIVVRGGEPLELNITLGERPARGRKR